MKDDLKKYKLEKGRTIFKKSKDGRKLRLAILKTEKKTASGTIFFLGGHREFIEKYSQTFLFFMGKGFNVITLDWRGWGLSERPFSMRPKVQHISDTLEYQLDLDTMIDLAIKEKLTAPWYLIAHSLGCLIGLRRLIIEPQRFSKYIFLSPLWGNVRFIPKPLQKFLINLESVLKFLQLTKITSQNPQKYKPYSLTVDFKENTLTTDKSQFNRLQTILKENTDFHSGTPTLGYLIAILKEIDALNKACLPNRKILVLIAQKEQITDNSAVLQLIEGYDFVNIEIINKSQHEILIEKEEIRRQALALIEAFICS